MRDRVNLTAAQLLLELSALPPDTVIKTTEHDSEWMRTYVWAISGVSPEGYLQHGNLISSSDDFDDDLEDDGD